MDLIGFALIVAALAAAGIRIGILLAPRIERLAQREDDDPGDK